MSSHTEEFCLNETVCLWMTIYDLIWLDFMTYQQLLVISCQILFIYTYYIYIYIYIYIYDLVITFLYESEFFFAHSLMVSSIAV